MSSWSSQILPKITGSTYGVQARSTLALLARTCTDQAVVPGSRNLFLENPQLT